MFRLFQEIELGVTGGDADQDRSAKGCEPGRVLQVLRRFGPGTKRLPCRGTGEPSLDKAAVLPDCLACCLHGGLPLHLVEQGLGEVAP